MTALAFIVPLAGIHGHDLPLRVSTGWARQHRVENDFAHDAFCRAQIEFALKAFTRDAVTIRRRFGTHRRQTNSP